MRLDINTDPNAIDHELQADVMRVVPGKISEV